MNAPASFEETYPRYPFAELVRLSLVLSRAIVRERGKHGVRGRSGKPVPA